MVLFQLCAPFGHKVDVVLQQFLELIGIIDIHGGETGGAGHGVSAHGEQMRRCRQAVHDLTAAHEGTQRQGCADGFSHDDAVGDDVVILDGEHLAGAPESLLHFLGNEEDAVILTQLVQLLHEDGVGRQQSAVALYRLDDHRGDLVDRKEGCEGQLHLGQALALHHVIGLVDAVEREGVAFRKEGAHLLLHTGGAGGEGGGTVGAAVIAVYEGHDLLPSRVGTGELDGGVVSVGAAVAEAHLGIDAAGIDGHQTLGIGCGLVVVAVSRGILGEFIQLLLDGFGDHRVGAAQIQTGGTGEEIDELIAVLVGDDGTLCLFHCQRKIGQMRAG